MLFWQKISYIDLMYQRYIYNRFVSSYYTLIKQIFRHETYKKVRNSRKIVCEFGPVVKWARPSGYETSK